jgi:hypothetical protein
VEGAVVISMMLYFFIFQYFLFFKLTYHVDLPIVVATCAGQKMIIFHDALNND